MAYTRATMPRVTPATSSTPLIGNPNMGITVAEQPVGPLVGALYYSVVSNRALAEQLDAQDPLASFRDLFAIPPITRPLGEDRIPSPGAATGTRLIYLDGNSLGRPPKATLARLRAAAEEEWAGELIRGWAHWIE